MRVDHFGGWVGRLFADVGVCEGTGHLQAARLTFSDARLIGDIAIDVGVISDGPLCIEGHSVSLVPIPCSIPGPVTAGFLFQNGATVQVEAKGVECRVFGPVECLEAFDP